MGQQKKHHTYDPAKNDLTVISLKSFALGLVFLISFVILILNADMSTKWRAAAVRIAAYMALAVIFYLLEFFCTYLFNCSEVDDDSFVLNDTDLHLVHALSLLELVLHTWVPLYYRPFPYVGILLAILGQSARTLALYTAGELFNHYVQREFKDEHKLVTHGIFKFIRHPSYFGFFWWFVGLQLWLGNVVVLIFGIRKLWAFFKERIAFEESFLVATYQEQYKAYKDRTPTLIPFIP